MLNNQKFVNYLMLHHKQVAIYDLSYCRCLWILYLKVYKNHLVYHVNLPINWSQWMYLLNSSLHSHQIVCKIILKHYEYDGMNPHRYLINGGAFSWQILLSKPDFDPLITLQESIRTEIKFSNSIAFFSKIDVTADQLFQEITCVIFIDATWSITILLSSGEK